MTIQFISLTEKIRKVLKGAIVIDKFPSEEEIEEMAQVRAGVSVNPNFQYCEAHLLATRYASFKEGVRWLKEQLTKDGEK